MVLTCRRLSCWRYYVAIAGLALVFLVVGEALHSSYAQTRSPAQSSQSEISQTGPNYVNSCGNAKTTEETNVCLARASLKAYKKQVFWAAATFFAGMLGTAAVLITLIWTVKSVRASERSADAAIASVATTLDVGRAQTRAYISFVDATVVMKRIVSKTDGTYIVPFFTIRIKNFGASPAIGFKFYTTAIYTGVVDVRLRNGGSRDYIWGDQNIPASEEIGFRDFPIAYAEIVEDDIKRFDRGAVSLVVTFHTVFTDVFGQNIQGKTSLWASFLTEERTSVIKADAYAGTAESMATTLANLTKQ